MRRGLWFAGGVLAGTVLAVGVAVVWWTYATDYDDQAAT